MDWIPSIISGARAFSSGLGLVKRLSNQLPRYKFTYAPLPGEKYPTLRWQQTKPWFGKGSSTRTFKRRRQFIRPSYGYRDSPKSYNRPRYQKRRPWRQKMSYSRRRRRRRKIGGNGRFSRWNTRRMASKALRCCQQMQRNRELKYCDWSHLYGPGAAGQVFHAPLIDKGDDNDQRIGNKVIIQSMSFRFRLWNRDATETQTMRVIIIAWKDSRGGSLATSEFLSGSNIVIGQYTHDPTHDHESTADWRIIFDQTFDLSAYSRQGHCITTKGYNKINWVTMYNADTVTTPAEINQGLISVYVLPFAATNFQYEFQGQFRFTDD